MTKRLFTSELGTIVGYWLATQTNDYQDEFTFERWDRTQDPILVNPLQNTIRFGMRATGDDDEYEIEDKPFQVVLRDGPKGWIFKCDHWEEADAEYPLEVLESPHAILFLLTGPTGHIYLHVECRANKEAELLSKAFSALGSRKSKAKAAAARRNGKLGGRPRRQGGKRGPKN